MEKITIPSDSFLALPNDKVRFTLCNGVTISITFDSFAVVHLFKDTPHFSIHKIETFEQWINKN